jgi:hypothetical protein
MVFIRHPANVITVVFIFLENIPRKLSRNWVNVTECVTNSILIFRLQLVWFPFCNCVYLFQFLYVLTNVILQIALVLQSSVFWDVMAYSPLKVSWRFGGTCRLHVHGRRVSPARNQHEENRNQCWRWKQHGPPKHWLNFNGPHGVISRKTELFFTIVVRTSDPTYWSWCSFYWRWKYLAEQS